jgi:hypothetical protein
MNLSQAIAKRFNLDDSYENLYLKPEGYFHSIRCPLHHDETSSAGLNFRDRMFNCFSPDCGSMPFWKLAKELEILYDDAVEETNNIFSNWFDDVIENGTRSRPMVLRKQVEAYANFCIDRQLDPMVIKECGGYYVSDESHEDYGHLVFQYGKGKDGQPKTIKRRIIGQGDRFRQGTNADSGDSKSLFGRDFNKYDTVILLEGVTDYLTLWPYYSNFAASGTKPIGVVASFGAKLSKHQAYLLRNKTIFILFDRDFDGCEGATKAKELLREKGCNVHILEIPEEFSDYEKYGYKIDVNSAYCKSSTAFIDWLNSSLARFSNFDSSYVTNTFLAKDVPPLKRIKTNLAGLDGVLCGGIPVGLHAIAGKEKIGKSSLLIYLGIQAALARQKVLLVSYELTKQQMWARIASYFSEHIWSEIEDKRDVVELDTQNALIEMSNLIRVERDWTIDEVKTASSNFDVIGIDYIQRMPYEGADERAGIKRNTYSLGDIAYAGQGKNVILLSSMPETGTTIFKETNVIKYAIQTGWVISRIQGNLLQLENFQNTRGKQEFKVYLEMDYGHQRPKEIPPPTLSDFTRE